MSEALPQGAGPRIGRVLLTAGLVAGLALPWLTLRGEAGGSWLSSHAGAWIAADTLPRTTSHPVRPIEIVFEHVVSLASDEPVEAELDLVCAGTCALSIDGEPVRPGVGVTLQPGRRIRVRVQRDAGPPAIAFVARRAGSGEIVARSHVGPEGGAWLAAPPGAKPRPVRAAGGALRALAPSSPAIPWNTVAILGAGGLLLALVSERLGARAARAAPWLVGGAWVALFAYDARVLDGFVGFDVQHHLAYLRHVLERGRVPLPDEGIQAYQPPLFYLLAAVWVAPLGGPSPLGLRALTLVLGLVHLGALYGCLRELFPRSRAAAALALVVAAAAPVHWALFHAFTNEALVAVLSSCTVWQLLRVLRRPGAGPVAALALGVLTGAALLAKLSALVLVPVVLGALWLARPRESHVLLAAVGLLAVAVPYYGWIASEFGTPFVGNWDERVGFAWWQDPGVRDAGAYLRFGSGLADPWYAGFASVWDGVYTTFFADGLASGEPTRTLGPPWRHGLMHAAVVLGLVPAALLALGAVVGLAGAWQRPDPVRLALVGLGVAMAAAFVAMTLRVPSYAQAKAVYWSPAFVALFAAFALGIERVRAWGRWPGRIATGALAVWAVVSFASAWIVPGALATLHSRGERALASGRPDEARRHFERALERDEVAWARVGLCRAQALAGRLEEAATRCEDARERSPGAADAWFHSAQVARRRGDVRFALEALERTSVLAPDDARWPPVLAALARDQERPELARAAAEQWLRVDPGNPRALAIVAGDRVRAAR